MIQNATSRPTVMEVDLSALTHNLQAIRAHVGKTKIMAVVKANAYGHGLIESARQLEADGADYLGVALVEEGIELRRAGITQPILVFGGLYQEQLNTYLDYDLDVTASSTDKLLAIEAAAMMRGITTRVHLKIDTGMNRVGVQHDRLASFADAVLECKNIHIAGVYSHLAVAEDPDQHFTQIQIARFENALYYLKVRNIPWDLAHLANSAGLLGFPNSHFDMVRPGLALYGAAPAPHLENILPLRPAMTLKSQVVYFKVIHAGQGISYGQKWRTDRDTRIVTVPIGYGDGYSRRLSGRGEVLIRGHRYSIVGTICMDQMMVEIGPAGERPQNKPNEAFNGDEVVLIGRQGSEEITVAELAEILETTPHEILTATNLRVPRVYL